MQGFSLDKELMNVSRPQVRSLQLHVSVMMKHFGSLDEAILGDMEG